MRKAILNIFKGLIACMCYQAFYFTLASSLLPSKGEPVVFRPCDGVARLNRSAERICILPIDEEFACNALKKLIAIDSEWRFMKA